MPSAPPCPLAMPSASRASSSGSALATSSELRVVYARCGVQRRTQCMHSPMCTLLAACIQCTNGPMRRVGCGRWRPHHAPSDPNPSPTLALTLTLSIAIAMALALTRALALVLTLTLALALTLTQVAPPSCPVCKAYLQEASPVPGGVSADHCLGLPKVKGTW